MTDIGDYRLIRIDDIEKLLVKWHNVADSDRIGFMKAAYIEKLNSDLSRLRKEIEQ